MPKNPFHLGWNKGWSFLFFLERGIWEECAEIEKISRYELQQWGAHPDADNLISTAINYNLEKALGTITAASPILARRLLILFYLVLLDPTHQ